MEKYELILKEWIASLKQRDRSRNGIEQNFLDLFDKLKAAGSTFDTAYTLLPRAIKAHQPSAGLARSTYKRIKAVSKTLDKTEKEFIEEWSKSIDDTGTQAFFSVFPIERLDEDSEPKVFGNMSAKEYKAQRRYAEQFPVLDTTELEKRMHEREYNLDIEDLIKNVLGEDNG